MNKSIGIVITFVAGIVVGTAATYKIAEQKYRNIADDEIDSVIKRFGNRPPMSQTEEIQNGSSEKEKKETGIPLNKSAITECNNLINQVGYDKISKDANKPVSKKGGSKKKKEGAAVEAKTEPQQVNDNTSIYTVSPDEFNTLDGFDCKTLYYSSDNYVLNPDYQIMSDEEISATIGHDPYGHFGEYEDDTVFVRNEDLMCDYEILLSAKTCRQIQED